MQERKVVSINLDIDLYLDLERERGDVPRSVFYRKILAKRKR
jgi:hypothetical protein